VTPVFDEDVLIDPSRIADRDSAGVLRQLAGAGAALRRAVEVAPEWLTADLRAAGPPRAVLVAQDGPGSTVADVVQALGAGTAPVSAWDGDELPVWAGPGDALLVCSADGWRPRLSRLVELGARRGMAIAVAAPSSTPLDAAARQARAALAPIAAQRSARASLWTMLAPLLQALDALSAAAVPADVLLTAADALDDVAAACSPSADAVTNPAKLLALELGESRTVLAGSGPLGAAAARRFASSLALLAGEPSVLGVLPADAGALGALLERRDDDHEDDHEGDAADYLFRDRVDDPLVPYRLVILDDPDRPDGDPAAGSLEGVARSLGVRASLVPSPLGPPLVRFAAATALGDFAAAYLSLLRRVDPGALRPGEAADLYRSASA
jgi:glucose/mannose-6-phosphate isomerase